MEARNEAGSSWQPREEGLMEIYGILEHQISKTSTSDKSQNLQQELRHYSEIPDFNNYLVFILSRAEGKSFEIRQAAGLLLKNNLRNAFKNMSPANQHYIKLEVLRCLGSPDREIRSTTGTIISIIVQLGGVTAWPKLLHALGTYLDGNDLNQIDGAMNALSKICKDVPQALNSDVPGMNERPVNLFLPRFFKFLYKSMDQYLQGLFMLANDTMPEVQKLPYLRNVIEYALQVSQDVDNKVALEAREFWLVIFSYVLSSNKAYAANDESLVEAEVQKHHLQSSRFLGSDLEDYAWNPPTMNISAQEWESLIDDFQFGGSRRQRWTSQFTPLSLLLDLSLSSLLKKDFMSSIKLNILVFLEEFSFLLMSFDTSGDLRNSVSKIIETLKLVIQSPIDGVSVTFALKEQILVSTTSIIATLSNEDNDSGFDGVLAELEGFVAILIAIINRPNHVVDRQTRAVACECLRVLEERFPGLLAEIVIHHIVDRKLRVDSIINISVPLAPFNVPHWLKTSSGYGGGELSSSNGKELRRVVAFLLEWAQVLTPYGVTEFLSMVIPVAVALELQVSLLKVQFSGLLYTFNPLLHHLVLMMYMNFPGAFDGQEVEIMKRLFLISRERQHRLEFRLLSLHWLLRVTEMVLANEAKGGLVSRIRNYIYPNVFDPLALKSLKLDLFVLCYISLDSRRSRRSGEPVPGEKDVEFFLKYLDCLVHGFKWLPSQSTEISVGFRTIHKLLTGGLCHSPTNDSSTSKTVPESTIFRTIQRLLLNLILDSQKLVSVVVALVDRLLQCQNHFFLGENLLLIFDEHLLPKLTVSCELSSYFPIIDRICKSGSISPQRLLELLKKFMVFLANGHGPDSGLTSWSQGSRVIGICRTMLMHHHSSRLFIPLSHLLAFTSLYFPDLEVRDNARIYLRILVCIPGKKLRQILNFGEQHMGIYMGISPSSHANSFFNVPSPRHIQDARKSKSISSYIYLERVVPLLVKQSWSLSLPTLGLTDKSCHTEEGIKESDARVAENDDVGRDNSEFSLGARRIERQPEPLRVMDSKISRILEILRLHFSGIPDVKQMRGFKIKISCVLRFKSEPFKSIWGADSEVDTPPAIYATMLLFSSTAPYGNIPSYHIPFLIGEPITGTDDQSSKNEILDIVPVGVDQKKRFRAAVTIEIEPREPVPGLVDVVIQSNAESGQIIHGQLQSISVGIEDMFLRAVVPPNIARDLVAGYYSDLFDALWEACGSSSNTGRELFSLKDGKGVATIYGTQSVKLLQVSSSSVIHVVEQHLAPFVVSVIGEPLVTLVKDRGIVTDTAWKGLMVYEASDKVSDYEEWPLYLTYYNEEEKDDKAIVKTNMGCFQVLVFLPPRYHLLFHLEVSDVSTLVRIRTDHWPCLAYIDDYLEALFFS
ncbi:hypothetical protein V2J09_017670 [Rumex salicifolius]